MHNHVHFCWTHQGIMIARPVQPTHHLKRACRKMSQKAGDYKYTATSWSYSNPLATQSALQVTSLLTHSHS